MTTGILTEHLLESSLQVCRMAPLEPSIEGRSGEQWFCQPVGVVIEPVTVGDAVVSYFLSDGEDL